MSEAPATGETTRAALSLRETARELARRHQTIDHAGTETLAPFFRRVGDHVRLLGEIRDSYRRLSQDRLALSYPAEWLLDNYYVLVRTARQVEEALPESYYRQLPKLQGGDELHHLPRIYDMARVLALRENAQLELREIVVFVEAYQEVQSLTMGELWAFPLMLHIVLLESVLQASGRLTEESEAAGGPAFFRLPYAIADGEIVAAAIPTLHRLSRIAWRDFFEELSVVETILEEDPAGLFARMTFATRDRYRKVVESVAQRTPHAEADVARQAIALAREAAPGDGDLRASPWAGIRLPPTAHVGYYLLAEGRAQLEAALGYRPEARERLQRWVYAHPTFVYLGAIFGLTLLLTALLVAYAAGATEQLHLRLLALLFSLFPATAVSVSLVNWLVTNLVPPRILPKLDFSEGVPELSRTLVVIPAMLTSEAEVRSLIGQLERHYLGNADPHIGFALLTDFADAPEEVMPEDETLLQLARQRIAELNAAYPGKPFFVLHRRRLWNPQEAVWMGWERKRGKLHELNRLLRGATDTSFLLQEGRLDVLAGVRYVLTLDADTLLPRGAAARLAGALAHPLNQARFDPATGRVTAGYTVLQPRTEIQPMSANQSLFTRVFAGDTGIDLYTRAVSDVYQDLFGEGIFVGKGIYDLDAFVKSLLDRAPENTLLSHDLFEGIHGRAALVSDIVLYEDYPPHYLVQVRRNHRWIRGDWQLLPWLLPRVPSAGGERLPNPLSVIDRWKIVDNLRRSLHPPALLLLFIAGWTVLPGSPAFWTLLGVLTPGVNLVTTLLGGLAGLAAGASLTALLRSLRDSAVRWLIFLAFVPYEALLNLDASLTTLRRLLLTREHLLQWTTAAHTVRLFGEDVSPVVTWRNMISALLMSVWAGVLVYGARPAGLPIALPLLVVWLFSPQLAYAISRPYRRRLPALTADEQRRLRRLARRTWFFYERFVGPDDHWLPPDHFQEDPRGVVARRTSPTNIGLYLLSALAASDFGYIDPLSFTLRLHSIFDTLARLERYRGHFINWIDTATLSPLPPRYVSTVDSGNLAACFLTLRQACLQMGRQPAWRWARWQGLLDNVDLLRSTLIGQGGEPAPAQPLLDHLDMIAAELLAHEDDAPAWYSLFRRLQEQWLPALGALLVELVEEGGHDVPAHVLQDSRLFAERVNEHVAALQREIELLLPWMAALHEPPALLQQLEEASAAGEAWRELQDTLLARPARDSVQEVTHRAIPLLQALQAEMGGDEEVSGWLAALRTMLLDARLAANAFAAGFTRLAQQAERFLQEMDFSFLYDGQRHLFHIGYSLDSGRLDQNYYDLLASEARITSLLAIAKYDVPSKHWVHLSRPVTAANGRFALLSWSGTMFEYLMPPLFMRRYAGTLLAYSEEAAVEQQIAYGRQRGVPWGISESGFHTFDAAMNYQYRAFGVPSLGLKRGLAEDLVVAPYASLLALPIRPRAVLDNMDALDRLGMMGRYGYYEAVDFTESRLRLGQEYAIVRSFMAHHQGMILLAIANTLRDGAMVSRFHADPRIHSVELLLQEQAPQAATVEYAGDDLATDAADEEQALNFHPWRVPWHSPFPLVHYLSNGHYGVLFTNGGGGYSQWDNLMLTRWRPDTTRDHWGQWLYLQDEESGAVWSAGIQPTGVYPERPGTQSEILFHPHMVELRRHDHELMLQMEIAVAPDENVEIRRITLDNESERPRSLRLTSYAEVALADAATDWRHQAFAKLFVESEYLPQYNALLFHRRPRSADEKSAYMAHMLVAAGEPTAPGPHESDRARFLGRGQTAREPEALLGDGWLTGTTGPTLDPVMALGRRLALRPRQRARLLLVTAAAESRAALLDLLARYRSQAVVDRAFVQSKARAERQLRRLELDSTLLQQAQRLLSLLLYPHRELRAPIETLAANEKGQPGLWTYGISGDNPILLVHLGSEEELGLLQTLVRFHSYWQRRGRPVALVILNTELSGYSEGLHTLIHRLLHRMDAAGRLNQRGGIFVLKDDQLPSQDRDLLLSAARVILDGDAGDLDQQLDLLAEAETPLPEFLATVDPATLEEITPVPRPEGLQFDNGYGGFSGGEYVIYLQPGAQTPLPWINVVANDEFGFIAGESGGGYTWAVNSGENRLTAWRNDPVSDMPSEVLYLRDEETAEVWTPTPQPTPARAPYLVRHGAGYSRYEHHSHGLEQELRLFVAPDAPVKIVELRLTNRRPRVRRLTATFYAEPVLGTDRIISQQYIIPRYEPALHALLLRNPYSVEFAGRVAFVAASAEPHGLTADRTEFLGRYGSLRHPAALGRIGLEDRVAPGRDICAAMQMHVELEPGERKSIYFLVGQGRDAAESEQLLRRFLQPEAVKAAWRATQQLWDDILGAVQVKTPDPAMDLLLNRWLLYQGLACRLWGRSALYQSSGAYGFRDQLQDVMALLHSRPDLAREHIIRAAAHQFEEGDVLHWWHPPSGRGVRTRISDDLLWLPFVTAHYVATTGDASVLDEEAPFLEARPLQPGEDDRYGEYPSTAQTYSIFEHCQRALRRGSTTGRHGLPLIGGGDWNDGMNRVGIEGQGESVWLAWFLHATLTSFATLCERIGEEDLAARYRSQAARLREAIERHGWDGDWYLRAWYDDGAPLGSSANRECRIDAIAQSWGVLSGAADPERIRRAMQSVDDYLVRPDDRLILLFTPPFDRTPRDPGYIKGYLPGIRENGGQYTHAALWTIWAYAELGDAEKADALYRLTNPIYRAETQELADHYKAEPYVIAADVYGVPPHTGRGGWTWYTGSGGWMYRLGLEGILGIRREDGRLRLLPTIPPHWPGYRVRYRCGASVYEITVENDPSGNAVVSLELDGERLEGDSFPLVDDGGAHHVHIRLGEAERAPSTESEQES